MVSLPWPPSRPLVLVHDTTSLESRVIGDQSWSPILTAYSFGRGGPTSMIQGRVSNETKKFAESSILLHMALQIMSLALCLQF